MATFRRQTKIRLDRRGAIASRRDFLRNVGAATAAGALLGWTDRVSLAAETLRQQGKRCVLLWMAGGPSQFETLDPKPGTPSAGEAGSIVTSVPGIHLSENLPELAKQMGELAVIRSLTSKEGSHPRASYLMHHASLPMGGADLPTLGSSVAERLLATGAAEPDNALPSFVRIGRTANAGGAGMLGVDFDPLLVDNPTQPPRNAKPATSVARYRRRLELLGRLESDFGSVEGADIVADHRKLIESASKMILSPEMAAFDLEQETPAMRASYGEGKFANGCLLARRLLESGVTFVEVTLGGWDTHDDNHTRTQELCGQFDRPAARLLTDLKERGLLDSTLVIWMGEFGRTPRINARSGRDHYPKAFSAWLAGCGVRGGQVIGATDERGANVIERPVSPQDFFQSVYQALGIDPSHENTTSTGRPVKLVDGGSVIEGLLA
ncbi:hypothetical protein Pla108_15610 [Botrimarina colliarenosi]|uniref:DUF1501 domain-containing protein n=1 Tax=Botrimarina colliarenosi TaxID=2528001 RepID=A0A5C6AMY2_9BACT|nr:DUF1501 domain-containing protein [Botrimarina colliarenosi]TWU00609.1 hypothetical protein Pla108_15610 [Botrimarina colliarenosi]